MVYLLNNKYTALPRNYNLLALSFPCLVIFANKIWNTTHSEKQVYNLVDYP
jgi:hypothetical protein